jgi:single-stranded-DNA-specific exonuclease
MSDISRIIVRRPVEAINPQSHVLSTQPHPVLERVYRARRVLSAHELDRSLGCLLPPSGLKNLDQAAVLLAQTIANNGCILVVADFDADGATACALTIRALQAMGATNTRYIVPNRFEYGYGLTPEIVALANQHDPDLIVTVDNGISSVEGVQEARRRGIPVLITDHHLPGASLPDAAAIVNPNQPGDEFPSKHLAGVGVAFYLMSALRAHLRDIGWFAQHNIPDPNLAHWLDLVALGTVADLVPLDHNNRVLVAQGLNRINAGRTCVGIEALLRVAGRTPGSLTVADLGFFVAPRLNAAGRLEDMSLGIECLLTDDAHKAVQIARQLDELNHQRRTIERDMQEQAAQAVAALHLDGGDLPAGLCLYDDSWHQGIVGLVAARVKDRVHRPVIAFAPAKEGEMKGSARSVPGLHIRDALDSIAARRPELLQKFGGHAMAAGLTLARSDFAEFNRAFADEVGRWLSEDDFQGKIWSDGELSADDFSLEFAQRLRDAGPWGQGFPEPVFDGEFEVAGQRIVKDKHLKLTLRSQGTPNNLDAIAFNAAPGGQTLSTSRVRAAYRLDVNEYRGARCVQLIVEHMEPI